MNKFRFNFQPQTFNLVAHFVRARWHSRYLRGATLAQFQERRARQMVAFAAAHAPFYRDHWASYDLHNWRALPTVDKRQMMAAWSTFNTRGIPREHAFAVAIKAETSRDFLPMIGGCTVGLSSGTSGHRGLFLVGAHEQAAWAGTILARTLHRLPRRPLRVAFFLRSNSNLYEQVGGRLVNFRYFDLMLPISEAVAALNRMQPQIVVGPPSLLGLLADAQQAGQLHIRPTRLISVAEVLEAHDRRRLVAVWDAPVHEIYQCTEGLLAVSCARGALHVQEDVVALQTEPLPAGGGRVTPVVTDLWRTAQPIIRYRLNDVLLLNPQPCACGSAFRVIKVIEGRCDDICYFHTLDGSTRPFFPDTIRRMVLLAHPAIADYRVIQTRPGHLRIHFTTDAAADWDAVAHAVRASVQHIIAQYACQAAMVEIERGLPPDAPGTKRRRVRRSD